MAQTALSRRIVLGYAPIAALAISVTSATAQVDPIFAAIEKHRTEFNAYLEASFARDDGKISKVELQTKMSIENEARDELTSTAPTTVAGLLAVIAWLAEFDAGCMPDTCGAWLEAFAKSEASANLKAQGGLYA